MSKQDGIFLLKDCKDYPSLDWEYNRQRKLIKTKISTGKMNKDLGADTLEVLHMEYEMALEALVSGTNLEMRKEMQ